MEKRKQKLGLQLDAIEDEKKSVNENIQTIVNQISSYKENPDLLQPKDYPVLFSYELDVLKKLTEINFELESLIEAYPLIGMGSKSKVKDVCGNEQTETSHNSTCNVSAENNATASNWTHHPDRLTEIVADLQISDHDYISDADIQSVVRETVKEMSAKLGISQENMSAIKNYYEKSSSSYVCHSYPSTSRIVFENAQFEEPEKDTSPTICPEESSGSTETEILQALNKDIQHENVLVNLNCGELQHNNDDSTAENSRCSSSITQFSDYVDCLNNECSSSNLSSAMQKIQNSAVQKLNNYVSVGVSVVSPSNMIDKTEIKDVSPNQQSNVQFSALAKLPVRSRNSSPDLVVSPNIVLEPTKEENYVVVKNFEPEFRKVKKKQKRKQVANNEIYYDIPPKEVPKDCVLCAFSHIENPSEFYLHIVDQETQMIDSLTETLNELYKKKKSNCCDKESALKSIGRYCAVYIEEYDGWYRAEVLNWYSETKTDNVQVQLIDFGNKRVLSYKNLSKLNKEFAQLPKLAMKCHFPLMYPPGSTELETISEWPHSSIDALLGVSGLESTDEDEKRIFRLVYANYVEDRNSVAVDLINTKERDEEKTVGQILIDLQVVIQIIPPFYYDSEEEMEAMLYDDMHILNTAENINEAVAGYDARDEARICRFTKADGTCYKGKNCKLEHVLLPEDGFTTDKEEVFKEAMYSLTLPKMGDIVTLLITAYIDSCNFFGNIVRTPSRSNTGYVVDAELENLMRTINSVKVIKTFRNPKILPGVGEIVLVRPPSLNKWFRAVVRSSSMKNPHTQDSSIEVFTVDFGDIWTVNLKAIRKIEPHLLRLPFQAIYCYLNKYKYKKNCDKLQCEDFFMKNFYFKNFAAVVLSSELPLKVQLTRFDGINVGDALVRFGFAESTKYDHNPLDDCPIALS